MKGFGFVRVAAGLSLEPRFSSTYDKRGPSQVSLGFFARSTHCHRVDIY